MSKKINYTLVLIITLSTIISAHADEISCATIQMNPKSPYLPKKGPVVTRDISVDFYIQLADDHTNPYTGEPGIVNRSHTNLKFPRCEEYL